MTDGLPPWQGAPHSRRARAGRHALRSRAFAEELVCDAGIAAGTLVLDLGAGGGVLTRALAAAGARVQAVELDAAALRQLETASAATVASRSWQADATALPLPGEPFAVVANLPFAAGTAILRRLLGDPAVRLSQLDAIVEWGLAAKRTAVWPSTLLGCTWGAWYELSLVRRVPRACFAPPPSVDAAVLRATRRPEPLVPAGEAAAYEFCCTARSPRGPRSTGSSRAASSIVPPTSSASTREREPATSTRASGLGSTPQPNGGSVVAMTVTTLVAVGDDVEITGDPEARYPIYSVTKPAVAAAVLLLVREGAVELDSGAKAARSHERSARLRVAARVPRGRAAPAGLCVGRRRVPRAHERRGAALRTRRGLGVLEHGLSPAATPARRALRCLRRSYRASASSE